MIYEDCDFYIQKEPHALPWVKIFTKTPYKELSDMPDDSYNELWLLVREVEKVLRQHYSPDKINIASFANMLPQVHIHVIARFKDDEFFPNSVWGEPLRQSSLKLAPFDEFSKNLNKVVTIYRLNFKKHRK